MSQFPDIPPGIPWEETYSREWHNLIDYVGRVMAAFGVTPSGEIGGPGGEFIIRRRIRVAIVEPLDAEQPYMMVRTVRYANDPPVVGAYEWGSPPFEAYAEPPFELSDYAAFVWMVEDVSPEPPPALQTPMLDAHWQDGHWLVGLAEGGGAEKLVVVRAFADGPDDEPDPGSRFLIVQEVRPVIVDGTWNGTYEAFGDTSEVNVWPAMTAGQYAPFVWEPLGLQEKTTVLPLTRIGGVWYVKQRAKMNIERPTGRIKQMDCTTLPTSNDA